MRSLHVVLLAALSLATLAGCLSSDDGDTSSGTGDTRGMPGVPTDDVLGALQNATYALHVLPAIHTGHGLYEPTIEVSDTGVIYATAHTTGAAVAPSPNYYSTDDGVTWRSMPTYGGASLPADLQGGSFPLADEAFFVAGDDGMVWSVDVDLAAFPVHGWCNDAAELCYYNPNAYDRVQAVTDPCAIASLNDRPWAAYANGTLLMVNNPGGGPVQVGAMQVPPGTPVGIGTAVSGPVWNLCAGDGDQNGGGIPGIPDIRDDLFFAVPQQQNGRLVVVTGYADAIMDVQQHDVLAYSNVPATYADPAIPPSNIGNDGQVVFDADGALYAVVMTNTVDRGGFTIAASTDDAQTFTNATFTFASPVDTVYLDGNRFGPGALVNWGVVDGDRTDYYMAHLFLHDGSPYLTNVMLAVDDGPVASRHVQGAALGPDGRAYMIMSEVSGNDEATMVLQAGTMPLRVVVQQDGPTMPVR